MSSRQMSPLPRELRAAVERVEQALEEMPVPSWVIDRAGVVVWQNAASRELVGSRFGRLTLDWAPADVAAPVHEAIARVASGEQQHAAYPMTFEDARGRLLAAAATLSPLRHEGEIVGLVGVYHRPARAAQRREEAGLTPRQYEILLMLAEGLSTDEIAERLVLALDTVRNHIRAIFRAMRVNSRAGAVAEAYRRRLVPLSDE